MMMHISRRTKPLAAGLGLLVLAATPACASDKGWSDASGIGRDLLVAAALGIPAVQGDWAGDLQAGGSMVLASGVAYGLKKAFPETRPDRSDRKSFPSGHAALSFAAAASLENRYGWRAGLPAFAVATFVGVARVGGPQAPLVRCRGRRGGGHRQRLPADPQADRGRAPRPLGR